MKRESTKRPESLEKRQSECNEQMIQEKSQKGTTANLLGPIGWEA